MKPTNIRNDMISHTFVGYSTHIVMQLTVDIKVKLKNTMI